MPDDPADAHLSRRYLALLVTSLSLIALVCVTLLLPVPYVTMRPGPVFNTVGEFDGAPMITFGKGVKTYPVKGEIDFTTVSVTRAEANLSLLEAVASYFSAHTAVVPRRLIYADDESDAQAKQESQRQLDSSKDYSRVAGLRAAGYTVAERAVVAAVGTKVPASGRLRTGDVILAVDGTTTIGAKDVVEAVGARKPGEKVTIDFRRKGTEQTVTLTTVADSVDRKIPRVGVGLTSEFTYPIEISNHVGSKIGGPSAGAMFALGIYDRLTPGSLTAGRHVAGTGEIQPDGVVGPIGGIRQKLAGASRGGATIFLVPSKNCADAVRDTDRRGRFEGMQLVRVKTLDDAISSLEALAKNPKASVPGCGAPH